MVSKSGKSWSCDKVLVIIMPTGILNYWKLLGVIRFYCCAEQFHKMIAFNLMIFGSTIHYQEKIRSRLRVFTDDHYRDVIMRAMASPIIGVSIVYSTICSGADQRKHQSTASLVYVRRVHRWPVDSPHKGPVTREMFPFDDIIMDCTTFVNPTHFAW